MVSTVRGCGPTYLRLKPGVEQLDMECTYHVVTCLSVLSMITVIILIIIWFLTSKICVLVCFVVFEAVGDFLGDFLTGHVLIMRYLL